MITAEALKAFIERAERLNDEMAAIKSDQREVFKEAKQAGFSVGIIKELIKERAMSDLDRQDREALLQLYRGALGMLDGTPLGDAARRRLSEPPPEPDPDDPESDEDDAPAAPDDLAPTPEALAEARHKGEAAAMAGLRVLDNPYGADDPCRAAWDEGWCGAKGSDGMDIPDAWKPKKRPKPSKGDAAGDGDDGAAGGDDGEGS